MHTTALDQLWGGNVVLILYIETDPKKSGQGQKLTTN